MPLTTKKLALSGCLLELYTVEQPISYGYRRTAAKPGRNVRIRNIGRFDTSVRPPPYRARAKLRRLCFANAWAWNLPNGRPARPIFITLTFEENVTDPKTAHVAFTKALERINYQWRELLPEGLKYVVVPERQKRGAIHYHLVAFNLPFVPRIYDAITRIWGQGHVNVTSVRAPGALWRYLAKDMTSAHELYGKRFFSSRGLKQPTLYMDEAEIQSVMDRLPATAIKNGPLAPLYTPNTGHIRYERYFLNPALDYRPIEEFGRVTGAWSPDDALPI